MGVPAVGLHVLARNGTRCVSQERLTAEVAALGMGAGPRSHPRALHADLPAVHAEVCESISMCVRVYVYKLKSLVESDPLIQCSPELYPTPQ